MLDAPLSTNDAPPVSAAHVLAALLLATLPAQRIAAVGLAPRVTNVNENELHANRPSVVTHNMLHGFGNRLKDDTLDERLALLERAIAAHPLRLYLCINMRIKGRKA